MEVSLLRELQIPKPKFQTNRKSPNLKGFGKRGACHSTVNAKHQFGTWDLRIVWDLEFGT
jgi:hypothetical protein